MNREDLRARASNPVWTYATDVNGMNCTGRSTGNTHYLPDNPDLISDQEYSDRFDQMIEREALDRQNRKARKQGSV